MQEKKLVKIRADKSIYSLLIFIPPTKSEIIAASLKVISSTVLSWENNKKENYKFSNTIPSYLMCKSQRNLALKPKFNEAGS